MLPSLSGSYKKKWNTQDLNGSLGELRRSGSAEGGENSDWGLPVPMGHLGVPAGIAPHQSPPLVQPETLYRKVQVFLEVAGLFRPEGACVTKIYTTLWPPPVPLSLPKLVYFQGSCVCLYVVGGDPAWVLLCWGGCCFSKSYLLCLSSLLLFSPPPSAALPPPSSRPTLSFGKHICNIHICFGMDAPFHCMFYV